MSQLPDSIDPANGAGDDLGDPARQEIYHGYSVDDETQAQSTGDSLVDDDRDAADPLEEGWNPPEGWSAGQRFGNTPLEEELGETLDQRTAQEIPEPDPYAAAEAAGPDEIDGGISEGGSPEVGDMRAGRLVDPDEGARADTEKDLVGRDVGIDGAAASAEEAAVHVVENDAG